MVSKCSNFKIIDPSINEASSCCLPFVIDYFMMLCLVSLRITLLLDTSVTEKENQSKTAASEAAPPPCKKAKASKLKEAGQLEPTVELGTSFSKTPSSASNATENSSKV